MVKILDRGELRRDYKRPKIIEKKNIREDVKKIDLFYSKHLYMYNEIVVIVLPYLT